MLKRIALVAFKFPPMDEVGARRWAKFAKYMARAGIEIDVYTTDWGASPGSYDEDVANPLIHVHRIPCSGIHSVRAVSRESGARGLVGSQSLRVARKFMGTSQGMEEARPWGSDLVPALVEGLRETSPDALIATGGPFWAVHWAAEASRQVPGVPFVIDYRDPWTDLPGRESWDADRRKAELVRETAALERADLAVTVTDGLGDLLSDRLPPGTAVATVPNGYDCDDDLLSQKMPTDDRFSLVHAGNAAVGREAAADALLGSVSRLVPEMPEIEISFYGLFPNALLSKYRTLADGGRLSTHSRVTSALMSERMAAAAVLVQLNAESFPYLVSTKIYEYARLCRPVLSINYGGAIDELVRELHAGLSVRADEPESIDAAVRHLYDKWKSDSGWATEPAGLDVYSIERITDSYLALLAQVRSE